MTDETQPIQSNDLAQELAAKLAVQAAKIPTRRPAISPEQATRQQARQHRAKRAGPLQLLDMMPYRGVQERVAEKEGATRKPINTQLSSTSSTSSYGTIAQLNAAHKNQGYTTTLGAHLDLQPMNRQGKINVVVDCVPPKKVSPQIKLKPADITAQHIRDAIMLALQTGVNMLSLHPGNRLPQQVGFLLAFIEAFDKRSAACRNMKITYADENLQQRDLTICAKGEGVTIHPSVNVTGQMKKAFQAERQWLKQQLSVDEPGLYASLLAQVDKAWQSNMLSRGQMAAKRAEAKPQVTLKQAPVSMTKTMAASATTLLISKPSCQPAVMPASIPPVVQSTSVVSAH